MALELSLSKRGIAAAVQGQPCKRVKVVAGGEYHVLLGDGAAEVALQAGAGCAGGVLL